jgi:hypothetical protein
LLAKVVHRRTLISAASARGSPVILASGFIELPAEAHDIAARLSKPFTQRDLASVLSEAGTRRNKIIPLRPRRQ